MTVYVVRWRRGLFSVFSCVMTEVLGSLFNHASFVRLRQALHNTYSYSSYEIMFYKTTTNRTLFLRNYNFSF